MAYSRDWSNAIPIDHSKFKDIPGATRNLRVDLEERLAAILYGFTDGETSAYIGLKKVGLITIGTGSGTIPPGTGAAAAINLQGKTVASKVELITIDADGNEIQLTSKGNRLANDVWFKATNQAGNAGINILKVNTANQIEIGTGFGTHLIAPDTGPTAALQYAPKGYVDKEIAAIPGVTLFGAAVDKSASYAAQQAATDGFVEGYMEETCTGAGTYTVKLDAYTDANADPTTLKQQINFYDDGSHEWVGQKIAGTFNFTVKKSDYWKIVITGTPTALKVWWRPLGT